MRTAGASVDDLGNTTERAAERARSAWHGVGSGIAGEFTKAHDAVRIVTTMVNHTWSNLRSVGTTALRVGEQITRGFGVNFDVSSLIQNGVQLRSRAIDVTNSGFSAMGKRATQADVLATEGAVRAAGDRNSQGYGGVVEAMQEIVSKSSDLDIAKKRVGDIGRIALATGSNMKDLGQVFGETNKMLISMGVSDIEERGKRALGAVRLMAKQGQLGNLEIREMAPLLGRVVAQVPRFKGTFEENLAQVGALAQVSLKGGATSAAEATASAAAFARDITKDKTLKRFDAAGIQVFTDKSNTVMRSPEAIMADVMKLTAGDQRDIAKLFRNEASARAFRGFYNVYSGGKMSAEELREAPVESMVKGRASATGLQAMHAEFAKFRQTMSEEDVEAAAKLKEGSPEARAQRFQNQLEKIAASLAEKLLPIFEQLAPKALALAEALANLTTWVASNPGEAIVLAITGSIVQAGIGVMIRETLIGALRASLGASALGGLGGLGGAGGGAGGAVGLLGGAGGLAAIALPIAIAAAATLGIAAWTAHQDRDAMLDKHKEEASSAWAQHLDQRKGIRAALDKAGIETDPWAGITPEGARRFGGNKEESDKLEAAVRAHRAGLDGTGVKVTEEQAKTLSGSVFAMNANGTWGGAEDAKAKTPDPVPTLQEILAAQREGNDLLAKAIQSGSLGGVSVDNGARKGKT